MAQHRPSALELRLKRMIRDHPEAAVHPHSPSGPPIRTVMWTALADDQILGQAFWDTGAHRWVVRAADLRIGESSLVVEHPANFDHLASAITDVIDHHRRTLFILDTIGPELADLARSLRDRV